jgi:hypothetical protein
MTSTAEKDNGFPGVLRRVALISLVVGAMGSAGFFLRAGQRAPRLLLVMMALWVFSPFVALIWTDIVSKRWPVLTRAVLYGVMLAVALGSLAIYGADALWPRKSQAAFVYVAVPPASWLLSAIALWAAALISRRRKRLEGH